MRTPESGCCIARGLFPEILEDVQCCDGEHRDPSLTIGVIYGEDSILLCSNVFSALERRKLIVDYVLDSSSCLGNR